MIDLAARRAARSAAKQNPVETTPVNPGAEVIAGTNSLRTKLSLREILSRFNFRKPNLLRIGKFATSAAGVIGVLSMATSAAADIVETRRQEKNSRTIEDFEKDNEILKTTLSLNLQKAVNGKISFEKIKAGELRVERVNGVQILIFEKGWLSKVVIKDKAGKQIAEHLIPEGLRTPIEEFLERDVKQKAPAEYIEVDLTHPDFLRELQNRPDFLAIKKFLAETKTGAAKRGLKICVNKHSQKDILFIDRESGEIKNKISQEELLSRSRGDNAA
ncbi:MAG: hypothetical protein V2A63_04555 [Patescibacteria group bacterium]